MGMKDREGSWVVVRGREELLVDGVIDMWVMWGSNTSWGPDPRLSEGPGSGMAVERSCGVFEVGRIGVE